MERVHRKIVAEKKRGTGARPFRDRQPEIARARRRRRAAQRLQGVLAYEVRVMTKCANGRSIETTLVRVCASSLILTVPWFGQAIAAFAVDRLSHMAG